MLLVLAESVSHSRLLRRDGPKWVQVLLPSEHQDLAAEANRASARERAKLPAVRLDKRRRYFERKLDPAWLEAKRERDRERRRAKRAKRRMKK